MDIADDADGRVAIFTIDADASDQPELDSLATRRAGGFQVLEHVSSWLDGPYAGLAIAVILAVVLALGLELLRR